MELGLGGRRAVVTGGSKGIGLAIARELLEEGAAVAICARNSDELAAAERELAPLGTIYAQPADVTVASDVEDFMERSAGELGGIDCLVNNAGGAHPGHFESLTDDDWKGDLDVKLFSLIRCSRAVLPHMRAAGGGRIVNIGSVYARYPDPVFFATSVNRAAGLSFTKTLAMQLAKDNILVNAINIGFVTTPQWANIHQRRAPEMDRDEFLRSIAATEVPLGRFGETHEVSGLVAFLLGDRAGYITGASIDVAGGMGKYV